MAAEPQARTTVRPRPSRCARVKANCRALSEDGDPSVPTTIRPLAGPAPVQGSRSTTTGQEACIATCRDVEPNSKPAKPPRPVRTQYDDGGGRCPAEQHHRRPAGLEHGVDVDVACQRAGLSNGGAEDVVGGTPLLGDERRVRTLEGPAVPLAQRVHDAQPRRTSVRLLHGPPHGSGVGGRSVDPDDDRARCLSSVHHRSPFRSRVRGAWGRRQRPVPPGSGRRRLRSPPPRRPAG